MMTERRKYARANFNLPIKLSDSDSDVVTETKNISGNGAYCAIAKEIAPMTKLKIILLVPVKKNGRKTVKRISCEGVVVRKEYIQDNSRYNCHIGIYFSDIKESDRKVIISYIKTVPASQLS